MPLLFSLTQCGLSDLKAGEVCQKQAEAVPEKPATSRLFNAPLKHQSRSLNDPLCPPEHVSGAIGSHSKASGLQQYQNDSTQSRCITPSSLLHPNSQRPDRYPTCRQQRREDETCRKNTKITTRYARRLTLAT